MAEPQQDFVDHYLAAAVVGDHGQAVQLARELLEHRLPHEQVVELLAAAQRMVGERWERNQLSVADEHVVSGVTTSTLDVLLAELTSVPTTGLTLVVCAEGDWHSLAPQMFGQSLRTYGVGVRVLGPSTPAEVVAEFLGRGDCDSLAISCNVALFFPGVVRLLDAAHAHGLPVLVGGRAFGSDPRRALRLGADAWAASAAEAASILGGWRDQRPELTRSPVLLDPVALQLHQSAEALGVAALGRLSELFPPFDDYDERQRARTREDLVFIVQFLAAALLVEDDVVFTDFLAWLAAILNQRQVPTRALVLGLDAIAGVLATTGPQPLALLELGRTELAQLPG